MKKSYYLITTITAFLCINFMYISEARKNDIDTAKIQHIDMSDHTIFINVKKED